MGFFNNRSNPPEIPKSLNPFDITHSIRAANQKTPTTPTSSHRAHTAPSITPYLGLRSRLSQVWFNRWTVLLLLVLVHFLLTIGSLNDGFGDAKAKALSACTKVEDVGSAMASMPHYLSVGVNRLTASSITNAVQALMTILDMIITGIEQLILFVISMMTDTYVCLITMVIHGGLNATAVAVEKTTDALNSAIDGIANGVESKADDIQGVIDDAYRLIHGAGDKLDEAVDTVKGEGEEAKQETEDKLKDAGNAVGNAAGEAADEASNLIGIGRRELDNQQFAPKPKIDSLLLKDLDHQEATSLPEATGLVLGEIDSRDILPDKPDLAGSIKDSMGKMRDIDIDTSGFVSDLNDLNKKIPQFEDVKNLTKQAVSFPFNLIREELNKAYGGWQFNDSVFPVAQKEALSFCSDNSVINDFFEGLFDLANMAKIVAVVLLSLLAVAACVPMAWMEIRRWRRQQSHARLFTEHSYDKMDTGYMYSRPTTARVGIYISTKLTKQDTPATRKIMIRWAIAYATSLPAIFVLSLALAGFFSCLCQSILLKSIETQIPELANQVGDFAGEVVGTLENVSGKWANDSNGVITSFSSDINDDVLGKVTNATAAVNDTLNTFMDEIDKGINTAFGDTLFKDLASEVVKCLIGLKVDSVQRGLTWVHDHAHINFPLFPNDVFSLGASKSISGDSDLTTFLASPSSVTTDEVTGAVTHVTDWLYNNIIQAALISTGLLLVYIVIVLIGVIRAMSVIINPPGHRGDGAGQNSQVATTPNGRRRSRSLTHFSSHGGDIVYNVRSGTAEKYEYATPRHSIHPQFGDEKR